MNSKKLFKKGVSLVTVFCMLMMSVSCAFTDLSSDHWAYNAIDEMVANDVLSGYNDGTFKPDAPITRAEFATVLVKTLKVEDVKSPIEFKDMEGIHWAEPFVDLANPYLTGYVQNGEYYFRPETYALREDAAVAIVKAKGLVNDDVSLSILDKFSDKDEISENLRKYVAIAVKNGLMKGNANGTFNPQGNLTRAEVAALFNNIYEYEKIVIGELIEEETPSTMPEFELDEEDMTIYLGKYYDKYEYSLTNLSHSKWYHAVPKAEIIDLTTVIGGWDNFDKVVIRERNNPDNSLEINVPKYTATLDYRNGTVEKHEYVPLQKVRFYVELEENEDFNGIYSTLGIDINDVILRKSSAQDEYVLEFTMPRKDVVIKIDIEANEPVEDLFDIVGLDCEKAIRDVNNLRIMLGYEDGTFKPEETITRAEVAVIVCHLIGIDSVIASESQNKDSVFTDVKAGEWYTGYINILSDKGLLKGMPESDKFRPSEEITLNEMAGFCINALGRGIYVREMGTWPANYIAEATKLGIFKDIKTSDANRGNIAIMLHNTLDTTTWDVVGTTISGELNFGEGKTLREIYFGKDTHTHNKAEKIYDNEDGKTHKIKKYCKICNEVLDEKDVNHKYKADGKCECGARELGIKLETYDEYEVGDEVSFWVYGAIKVKYQVSDGSEDSIIFETMEDLDPEEKITFKITEEMKGKNLILEVRAYEDNVSRIKETRNFFVISNEALSKKVVSVHADNAIVSGNGEYLPGEEVVIGLEVNDGYRYDGILDTNNIFTKDMTIKSDDNYATFKFTMPNANVRIKLSIVSEDYKEPTTPLSVYVGNNWHSGAYGIKEIVVPDMHYIELEPGNTYQLKTKVDEVETTEGITFELNKSQYIDISSSGKVTAKEAGETWVTAKLDDGTSASFLVKVIEKEKLPEFEIDEKTMTLALGENWNKYEVSAGMSNSPTRWYEPVPSKTAGMPIGNDNKIHLADVNWLDNSNVEYMFVRDKDNTDLGYKQIEIPKYSVSVNGEGIKSYSVEKMPQTETKIKLELQAGYEFNGFISLDGISPKVTEIRENNGVYLDFVMPHKDLNIQVATRKVQPVTDTRVISLPSPRGEIEQIRFKWVTSSGTNKSTSFTVTTLERLGVIENNRIYMERLQDVPQFENAIAFGKISIIVREEIMYNDGERTEVRYRTRTYTY